MPPSALDLSVAETLADFGGDPIVGHLEPLVASSALAARFPERIPRSLFRLALTERHD